METTTEPFTTPLTTPELGFLTTTPPDEKVSTRPDTTISETTTLETT